MNKEKTQKITHEGTLELTSEVKLPCYVLEDGTRVISGRGMQNVLKISPDTQKSEELKPGGELARFIGSKWFNELTINGKRLEHFKPIVCYKAFGFGIWG